MKLKKEMVEDFIKNKNNQFIKYKDCLLDVSLLQASFLYEIFYKKETKNKSKILKIFHENKCGKMENGKTVSGKMKDGESA